MNSLNIQVKTPWQKEKQTVKLTAAQAGKTLQQQTNKERVLKKIFCNAWRNYPWNKQADLIY